MDCSESVNEMLDDFKSLLNDDLQKPVESFTKCVKAKHIHTKAKAITCGDEFWHAFILCKDKLPMDKMMRPLEPIKLVIDQLLTMLPINGLTFPGTLEQTMGAMTWQQNDLRGGYRPRPKYLSIPGYDKCISSVNLGTYTALCLPRKKPNACLKDAWDQIKDVLKVRCPLITNRIPSPILSAIPDWKECFGYFNPNECMVPNFPVGICLDIGWIPSRCSEIQCVQRCNEFTHCLGEADQSEVTYKHVSEHASEEMDEDTSEIEEYSDKKEAEDAIEEEEKEINAEGSGSEDDNVEYSKEQEDEYEEEEAVKDDDEYEKEEELEEDEDEYEEEE